MLGDRSMHSLAFAFIKVGVGLWLEWLGSRECPLGCLRSLTTPAGAAFSLLSFGQVNDQLYQTAPGTAKNDPVAVCMVSTASLDWLGITGIPSLFGADARLAGSHNFFADANC